jgi:hypothetical protein
MRDLPAILLLAAAACARGAAAVPEPAPRDAAERVPVLVELFTSEGCSSCPRADALLALLAREQPLAGVEILALAEHVDYWDDLGWKDDLASAELTARQRAYAERRGRAGLYTPAAVVDGSEDVVGSDARSLEDRIRQAAARPKARLRVSATLAGRSLALRVAAPSLPPASARIIVAVVEDGVERAVSRGENAGRRLRHHAVVRKLARAGEPAGEAWTGDVAVPLEEGWNPARLRAVAFAEDRASGRIVGAGAARVERADSRASADE